MSGCEFFSDDKIRERLKRSAQNKSEEIVYIQDKRTGLCFAVWSGGRRMGMTIVPCKDVKDYIQN